MVSAAVLVGGHSRRMGRDKAMLPIQGVTLLERTAKLLSAVSDDVLVIGGGYEWAPDHRFRYFQDAIADCGPLGGIFTALHTAVHDRVVVVACDLPFLNVAVLDRLSALGPDSDATVPHVMGYPQPMHAVYNKTARPSVEAQLAARRYRLGDLLSTLDVCWVDVSEIEDLDPACLSFVNVNTVGEWHAAKQALTSQ